MKRRALALLLAISFTISGCGAASGGKDASGSASSQTSDVGAAQGEVSDGVSDANKEEAGSAEAGADASEDGAALVDAMFSNLPELNMVDDKYRTTYEVFVYSFADSNGDGIGDISGLINKLDYINDGDASTYEDLGCDQIWLMPVSPSPTYHKYDVTDYMDIDPQYGTLEDFDNLVKECHKRGVNLIIDTVLNHTSIEHPWFLEAKEYLKSHTDIEALYAEDGSFDNKLQSECPYLYYYNFSKENQTGFEKLNGTEWYYEARFWSGMPDLNLDNDMVKEEIAGITDFWTKRGVDGFRLDAVSYYYTDNNEKNIEFMTWLNDTVKKQNKDAYIVAEAWTAQSTYASYYASCIDSFFDFEFSGSEGLIATVARGKKAPSLYAKAMADEEELYSSVNPDYVNAPFYTNHDMARSAGYFVGKKSEDMVKMAGALNLLMGGNAFIYYGEELGMKGSGKDENKRAPMQWTGAESLSEEKDIMCQGPTGMERFEMIYPPLDEQKNDPYSVYNYYKKAIRLRNTYPVIARGKTQVIDEFTQDRLTAFVKYLPIEDSVALGNVDESYGETALLILINNGLEAQTIDLSSWSGLSKEPSLAYTLSVNSEDSSLEGTTLTIPAYGIAVVK